MSAVQITAADLDQWENEGGAVYDEAEAPRLVTWWSVTGYRGTTETYEVSTYRAASRLVDQLASFGYVCLEARKHYGRIGHAPDCAVLA